MRRLCWTLVTVLLLMADGAGFAHEAAVGLYNRANELYEQGEYKQAAETYERIVQTGLENGKIYYNLGNAYFKNGQIGRAILAYERALRLMPRDEDIRANLDYARLLTVDKVEHPQQGAVVRSLLTFQQILNLHHLTLLVFCVYLSICSLVVVHILARGRGTRRAITYIEATLVFLLLVFGTSLAIKVYNQEVMRRAVILSSEAVARSGPGDEYTTIFTLHEGTRVEIHQEREGWALIKLPGGMGGWVERKAMERI